MYADLKALLARAGRLAPAWGDETNPDYADLERFLEEVSNRIDVALSLHGIDLPLSISDTNVEEAVLGTLGGIAADGALVMALEATWTAEMPEDVSRVLQGARTRYEAAMTALEDGTSSVVTYLLTTSPDSDRIGATAQWVEEPDYPLLGSKGYSEYTENPLAAPTAYRKMRY